MAQKIRVDITNATGDKVGTGPLYAVPALTFVRAFDGAGSIELSLPGTEERAIDLATNERRASAYVVDDHDTPRYVGAGVLRTISVSGGSGAWTLRAGGPDLFDELRRVTVLVRREYREAELRDVVDDLLLLAGWVAIVDEDVATQLVTVRFDGESVLKAIQALASNYGLHFREGLQQRQLEFGAFGQRTDIVALTAKGAGREVMDQDNLLLITRISVKRDTSALVNWILPIGAGEGLAVLTLEHSTRTGPYEIRQMFGPDGSILYYLQNDDSVAEFGIAQKVGSFRDITPIDNTDIGIERAANALYDAAVAYLQRYSGRLDTYSLTVTKVNATVRPGDKIRLVYRGIVTNERGIPTDFLAVDEWLWVLKVSESFGHGAATMSLEVATVDRYEDDVAKVVVGAIDTITLRNLRVQPYPNTFSFVYPRELDATHTAEIPLVLTDGVLYLDRCRLNLKTRPFRATAKSAATIPAVVGTTDSAPATVGTSASGGGSVVSSASGGAATSSGGGDHRHQIAAATSPGAGFVTSPGTGNDFSFGRVDPSNPTPNTLYISNKGGGVGTSFNEDLYTYGASGNHTHTVPNHTHSVTIAAHTHDITIPAHSHGLTIPGHTHDILYGIVDDNQYPDTVHLSVNGVDVTVAAGGPWGVGGSAVDQDIDITNQILGTVGGIRQRHSIVFSCEGGQGQAEVTVECKVTVQSLQQV